LTVNVKSVTRPRTRKGLLYISGNEPRSHVGKQQNALRKQHVNYDSLTHCTINYWTKQHKRCMESKQNRDQRSCSREARLNHCPSDETIYIYTDLPDVGEKMHR